MQNRTSTIFQCFFAARYFVTSVSSLSDEVSGGKKALENGAGSVLHLWRAAADTLGCDDLGLLPRQPGGGQQEVNRFKYQYHHQ
jgi:hypothetical protein